MSLARPASGRRSPRRGRPLLSRRAVASAGSTAVALLVAGCTRPERKPLELPARPADPDEPLVAEALLAERVLVGMLEATGRRHRALRAGLRDPLRIHRAHVRLLADAADGSSSEAASPRVRIPPVPAREAAAVAALASAEGRLRDRHARTALRAESGVLARLLGGLAAAAAQQEVLLPSVGVPVVPAAGQPS